MCHAVTRVHSRCHHARHSTDLYPCDKGYNSTHGCNAQRFTDKTLTISHPSLCVDCYRVEETFICEQFEEEMGLLRDNAERAVEALQQTNDLHGSKLAECKNEDEKRAEIRRHAHEIAKMDDFVANCYSDLQDLADEKKDELRRFRDEQGVWGDG